MTPITLPAQLSPFLIQIVLMAVVVALFFLLFRFLSARSQRKPFIATPPEREFLSPTPINKRQKTGYSLSAAMGLAGMLAKIVYYIFLFANDQKMEDLKNISHDLVWGCIMIFIFTWTIQKDRPN